MAQKTVLRRLLLRWSPMSLEDRQILEEDEKGTPADSSGIMEIDMDIAGEKTATVQETQEEKPTPKPKKREATKPVEDEFFG